MSKKKKKNDIPIQQLKQSNVFQRNARFDDTNRGSNSLRASVNSNPTTTKITRVSEYRHTDISYDASHIFEQRRKSGTRSRASVNIDIRIYHTQLSY